MATGARRSSAKSQKRGSSDVGERRVHSPEAVGATPAPASKKTTAGKRAGRAAGLPSRAEKGSTPFARSTGKTDPDAPHIQQFITEYLGNGMNATAAWLKVFPETSSPAYASTAAWRLLRNDEVRQRVDAERARLAGAAEIDREALVRQLAAIVLADPAELTQMRRARCPDCWPPDAKTTLWTEPNPDCETCAGEGETRPWFADTRTLSPAARALFLGVKVSDKGIQVLTESKDAARDKLAKIIGAYEVDNRQRADALATMLERINAAGSTLPVHRDPDDADRG